MSPTRKRSAAKVTKGPTRQPVMVGTISPADPTRAPNNPFYVRATQLARARDKDGLRKLDRELAQSGYSVTGQTRVFIASALAKKEG